MKYVKLGNTGLDVSKICLGCMSYGVADRGTHAWTLDADLSRPFIRQALDASVGAPALHALTQSLHVRLAVLVDLLDHLLDRAALRLTGGGQLGLMRLHALGSGWSFDPATEPGAIRSTSVLRPRSGCRAGKHQQTEQGGLQGGSHGDLLGGRGFLATSGGRSCALTGAAGTERL